MIFFTLLTAMLLKLKVLPDYGSSVAISEHFLIIIFILINFLEYCYSITFPLGCYQSRSPQEKLCSHDTRSHRYLAVYQNVNKLGRLYYMDLLVLTFIFAKLHLRFFQAHPYLTRTELSRRRHNSIRLSMFSDFIIRCFFTSFFNNHTFKQNFIITVYKNTVFMRRYINVSVLG